MPLTLAEVAKELDVQPGKPVRETAQAGTLELRFVDDNDEVRPEYADWQMMNAPPFPDPPGGIIVKPTFGPDDPPAPFFIEECDRSPELSTTIRFCPLALIKATLLIDAPLRAYVITTKKIQLRAVPSWLSIAFSS